MKTGLVLEGGAMRGMFTAGVLDVMLDMGLSFNAVIGVSAGALFGINFLSRQKGRVIRYNKKFNGDRDYMGFRPLFKEGNFISAEYAYERVPRRLDPFDDAVFMQSGVPFYATLTDIETGKPEYVLIESVFRQMDTLRASGSMPFISKPVEIDGKRYLDGGISDSIPFEALKAMGCDRLAVILTRDLDYRKKPMSPLLISAFYNKYPNLAAAMKRRHEVYNSSIERLKTLEQSGTAYVLRPSQAITIKRTERSPEKLQSVYDLGVSDAKAQVEKLKRLLFDR